MPLRAIHAGRDVVAPLCADEWSALCTSVTADPLQLRCPECHSRTVPRISKLGLQHFYHYRRTPDCPSCGETEQHRQAKTEIVLGCRDAGYMALPEYSGQGWRADVYAEQGKKKVAFEVQWSYQHPVDFDYRQERYKRDGIRACWFVRNRRKTFEERSPFEIHEGDSKSLPSFRLVNGESGLEVQLGARSPRLRQFVCSLLQRRVQFRPSLKTERAVVEVGLAGHTCRCGHDYNTCHLIGEWQVSFCGLRFGFRDYLGTISPHERLSIVKQFLHSERGLSLHTKLVQKHYEWRTDSYWTFVCPECGASAPSDVFCTAAIRREELRLFDSVFLPLERKLGKCRGEGVPHWCFSDTGVHC